MIPPRRIVLSGGGIKVISLVGALKVLHGTGQLKKIREICGVSAGAWLGFMVAAGCPIAKIEGLVLDIDFSVIRNLTPEALLGFPETFGLDDGTKLAKFLESITRVVLKLDPEITFEGLAAIPGSLPFRCWATDLNTQSIREFSAIKTPTVKILDALRASMCIPLYFVPVKDPINQHMLIDGGIQGNLPLNHLTKNERQESLSLGFCHKNKAMNINETPQDLMGFMNAILNSLSKGKYDAILEEWDHTILRVPVDDFPSWNFEADRKDRQMLLTKGILAATEWVNNPNSGSKAPLRRHSF
jgi:predicted acylesterase/phospholipase RssA